ncbi:MAG: hypothetical protein BWY75_03721 [bacterium ADurb.Bin425]|nr:MAG: hypothetical protein BWY75_03721 [bacterium ADurb.Bin425]
MPGLFDHVIEGFFDILPKGVAVRSDNHAAFDGSIVSQLSSGNRVGIPACIAAYAAFIKKIFVDFFLGRYCLSLSIRGHKVLLHLYVGVGQLVYY